MKKLIFFNVFLVLLLSKLFMANAFSQNQEDRTINTDKEDVINLTVKVTADKKLKDAVKLPYSLSVFEAADIEEKGIDNAEDIVKYVPNMTLDKNASRRSFIIRGIKAYTGSTYSPVGIYIDDICMPLTLHNPDLYEIERIEVLKGPQGTLYGRNAESGVINIITKQPDNELRASVKEDLSVYDTSHGYSPYSLTSLNIGGPVKKDLIYFGVSGVHKFSRGYLLNTYNDDDEAGSVKHINLRGTLRFTPSDRWDISLIADGLKNDDGAAAYRYSTGSYKTERHEMSFNSDIFKKEKGNGQTLKAKFMGNGFDIVSVTGHRFYENDFQCDLDCTSSSSFDRGANHYITKERILSEEFRITSSESSSSDWLAGIYIFNESMDKDFENIVRNLENVTSVDSRGVSGFGEYTLPVFKKIYLTAGIRYDFQNVKGSYDNEISGSTFSEDLSYNEFLPKCALLFDVQRNTSLYVSAAKGYMTGGCNYSMGTSEDSFKFDPEYSWNYEAGVKAGWLKNRVRTNLSFFYIDIKDKQVYELDLDTMTNVVENAAKAHSTGAELQLFAMLPAGFTVNASCGCISAEIDSWKTTVNKGTAMSPNLVDVDYSGKKIPYVAKYTYNVGIHYFHSSGFGAAFDLRGTSDFYTDTANTLENEGYIITDVKLSYKFERVELSLYCDNVFDQSFETYTKPVNGNTLVIDGEPRKIGFSIKAEI